MMLKEFSEFWWEPFERHKTFQVLGWPFYEQGRWSPLPELAQHAHIYAHYQLHHNTQEPLCIARETLTHPCCVSCSGMTSLAAEYKHCASTISIFPSMRQVATGLFLKHHYAVFVFQYAFINTKVVCIAFKRKSSQSMWIIMFSFTLQAISCLIWDFLISIPFLFYVMKHQGHWLIWGFKYKRNCNIARIKS